MRTALGVSVGLLQGFCKPYATVGLDSGGGIRTRDLRVMSPTSYQTAPPRGGNLSLATSRETGQDGRAVDSRPDAPGTGPTMDTEKREDLGSAGGAGVAGGAGEG